jgi:Tol biopolymer transport system component
VRRLLRRCLEKDPARRLQHIGDARLELEEIANTATHLDQHAESLSRATSAARARSRVLAFALLGALALAATAWIAAASGWLGAPRSSPSRSAEITRFTIELHGAQQVTTDVDALSFAISPDGRRLAWIGLAEPNRRIYARSLDRLDVVAVPGTEGVFNMGLSFSPDGRQLLFHRDGALWRIPVEGGLATKILEGETKTSLWVPDWADNGIFLPTSRGGLIRADAAGGPPQTLTEIATDRESQHVNPSGVPQANAVLFAVGGPAGWGFGQDHVELLSLDNGERTVVLERAGGADYVGTGHLVFGRGDTLFAAPFDLERRATGPEVPLLGGLALDNYSICTQFVMSDAGTLVYVPEQGLHDRQPTWVWSDGRSEAVDLPAARYRSARLSPDGSRLAVSLSTTVGSRLRILSLDTGVVDSVEAFDTNNSEPVWGPTGRSLLFSGASLHPPDLFVLDLDADEAPVRLTESPSWHFANDWSADGNRVAYTGRSRDDQLDLYVLDLTKKDAQPEPYATSTAGEVLARFSPDGRGSHS